MNISLSLEKAHAKKTAEKEEEYRLHAEAIAASLTKSVFELKQAPLIGFYDERNADYENYLLQKAEAARAAEVARLAAEKAENERIEAEKLAAEKAEKERIETEKAEAAKAAAEKERIEAENARLAAEKAEAEKAAEALAFLNAEYAERVGNMVPKTVYVLKEATNDKFEYYEAHLETLATQKAEAEKAAELAEAEKAAKLAEAQKAPTKEIVREVVQTAKTTGKPIRNPISLNFISRQQNDETQRKIAKTLCPVNFSLLGPLNSKNKIKGKDSR